MSNEEVKDLPLIKTIPVISPETWRKLRTEMEESDSLYFWSLSARMVKENPEHRDAYEGALRENSGDSNDMTGSMVILFIHALDVQAKEEGFCLPEIPSPINPKPALRRLMTQVDNTSELIDLAYNEILKTNPIVEEIIGYMIEGAPDAFLKITSERQAKTGAVYVFYGIQSVMPASFSENI